MKYNREEAVKKATNLYWQKGFHATSMRNLQEVIDMRPGSIYACFGSKEGLFKESLKYYNNMWLLNLSECEKAAKSPLNALKSFMELSINNCDPSIPSNMCMLAKTVSELTTENNELLELAKQLLRTMELSFALLFQQAKEAGEISKSAMPSKLAQHFQIQLMGLRSYAAINNDQATIQTQIDDLFSKSYSNN